DARRRRLLPAPRPRSASRHSHAVIRGHPGSADSGRIPRPGPTFTGRRPDLARPVRPAHRPLDRTPGSVLDTDDTLPTVRHVDRQGRDVGALRAFIALKGNARYFAHGDTPSQRPPQPPAAA